MTAVRWLINSVTFRQYSLIQAAGWLIIGDLAEDHSGLWAVALIAAGVMAAATILGELLRAAVRLPRDRPPKKTTRRDRAG